MVKKCIIIDDEPIAIDVIKSYLSHFNDFEIVGECENAIHAIEVINNTHVDLMFLNIQMPQISGIDFIKSISNPPKTIITTAYRDYAIDGYQLNVIDYLLKPISFERFVKAIDKFLKNEIIQIIKIKQNQDIDENTFIYVREGKITHKIHLNDILFIESQREYITIHLRDRNIKVLYKISEFEKLLPISHFLRNHKSFIISVSKISCFSTTTICVSNHQLTIGRKYMDSVRKYLENT